MKTQRVAWVVCLGGLSSPYRPNNEENSTVQAEQRYRPVIIHVIPICPLCDVTLVVLSVAAWSEVLVLWASLATCTYSKC